MGRTAMNRALVLGMGASGLAAARLVLADGMALRLTDQRKENELHLDQMEIPPDAELVLGGHPISSLEGISLLILSPGVPFNHPIIMEARQRNLEVLPEIEFAWRHRTQAPLAAVTGSNGKSTTTSLIAEMLRSSGISTGAGGNLGPPASDLILDNHWDTWVLEVSSFQAESFQNFRPQVGLLLNLSQDHLERHPSMGEYASAKARLFEHQRAEDLAILNADDPLVSTIKCPSRRQFFSLQHPADACLEEGHLVLHGKKLIPEKDIKLVGAHNTANALAAGLAALDLGASPEGMATALCNFSGLAHRHQPIHQSQGVIWINDSKATNVGSTLSAIEGYPEGSVHLILGGLAKNQDFSILRDAVSSHVAGLYLIGRDGAEIGRALHGCAPIEDCGTLDEAVRRARIAAHSGQWVILAPGCASFDQFSGYPERGDCFAALARGEGTSSCP